MKNLVIVNGGLTQDNTSGYSENQLHELNLELDARLDGVEYATTEYREICEAFSDEVSSR